VPDDWDDEEDDDGEGDVINPMSRRGLGIANTLVTGSSYWFIELFRATILEFASPSTTEVGSITACSES
jgi:hypothetical protein